MIAVYDTGFKTKTHPTALHIHPHPALPPPPSKKRNKQKKSPTTYHSPKFFFAVCLNIGWLYVIFKVYLKSRLVLWLDFLHMNSSLGTVSILIYFAVYFLFPWKFSIFNFCISFFYCWFLIFYLIVFLNLFRNSSVSHSHKERKSNSPPTQQEAASDDTFPDIFPAKQTDGRTLENAGPVASERCRLDMCCHLPTGAYWGETIS